MGDDIRHSKVGSRGRWKVVGVVAAVAVAAVIGYWTKRASAEGPPTVEPLYFAGMLSDSDGEPLPGSVELTIRLYDAAEGGAEACSTDAGTTALTAGHFRVALAPDCAAAVAANPDLWVEVDVGSEAGGTTLTRSKLGAVPYALEAKRAVEAAGGLDERIAALEARIAELEIGHCPPGFAYSAEGTYAVCSRTVFGVVDEMVKVGDFWIDRYETSTCPGSGILGAAQGHDTSAWACSSAGADVQAFLSWFQAAAMCANSGKRLCSNAEWQVAVSGTPDPPTPWPDTDSSDGCTGLPSATSCTTCAGSYGTAGAASLCVSRFGAFDMIGNEAEWTADWVQSGLTWMTSGGGSAHPWPIGWGGDVTYNLNGTSDQGAWTPGLPGVWARGGHRVQGVDGGAFALVVSYAPTVVGSGLTGRCCVGGP